MKGKIQVCIGKIIDGAITGIKKSVKNGDTIPYEEFSPAAELLRGSLLYVEGHEESRYDNSDDDRAGSYSSRYPFGYYCEIDPIKDSEHLLFIDGKLRGIVFFVSRDRYETDYAPFLFDGSISGWMSLGYGASHSSNYIYVERVSLVKRGEGNAPERGRSISFWQSKMSTSL